MDENDAPSRLPWPPLMFAASLVLGIGAHFLWPTRLWAGRPTWVGGVALLLFAVFISAWGNRALASARTTVRPDRPATSLVTNGPFAYSRNPLYVALCLLGLSVALLFNDIAPLIATGLLWVGLNFGVIPREERHLQSRFPEQYSDYRGRARRWI